MDKYNEALERAKKWEREHPHGYVIKDMMEYIFPGFRESEDERIRKRLINLIKELAANKEAIHTGGYFVDGQDKKYIAYLEKQKENPKSADSIPSDCVSDAKCEDKSPKHSDSDGTDIRDTPAYWKGWDDAMKQKEQKHPNGCFTCDEYKKGYESGRLNGFTAGYNKAMKEIDQKEQKPDDRFEEAREKYQVEWSEEDEDILNCCISSIEEAKENRYAYKETDGDTSYDREISWLKSLRPSWKPSEEQMEAFRSYIKDFQEKAEAELVDGITLML